MPRAERLDGACQDLGKFRRLNAPAWAVPAIF